MTDAVLATRRIPDGFAAYKRTAEFDQQSVPRGLCSEHRTKAGVWARIVVVSGALTYEEFGFGTRQQVHLDAPSEVVVPPEVPHRVQLSGAVRFFVEFHRASEL